MGLHLETDLHGGGEGDMRSEGRHGRCVSTGDTLRREQHFVKEVCVGGAGEA